MDERKKSGIDFEPEKVKVIKKNIIETEDNTIIISDFLSESNKPKLSNESDEDDEEWDGSEDEEG